MEPSREWMPLPLSTLTPPSPRSSSAGAPIPEQPGIERVDDALPQRLRHPRWFSSAEPPAWWRCTPRCGMISTAPEPRIFVAYFLELVTR